MHSPENERIKRAYFVYLKEARRLGEHSIDTAAAALARFEEYTKHRDFKRFHIQQAIGFKTQLSEQVSPRDVVEGKVVQDAREVRTKFSKTFTTWFFPVGEDVHQIVVDWVHYLDSLQLFGPSDPLFPATVIVQDQYHLFQTGGLSRRHWSNATPIRTIFKEAFTSAGLAYANPHSFRKTLAQLGERLCRTPEEFKAWSQNLGHEQVLTTFSSYGQVGLHRQAELIRHLADRRETGSPKLEAIDRMIRTLQEGRHALE